MLFLEIKKKRKRKEFKTLEKKNSTYVKEKDDRARGEKGKEKIEKEGVIDKRETKTVEGGKRTRKNKITLYCINYLKYIIYVCTCI